MGAPGEGSRMAQMKVRADSGTSSAVPAWGLLSLEQQAVLYLLSLTDLWPVMVFEERGKRANHWFWHCPCPKEIERLNFFIIPFSSINKVCWKKLWKRMYRQFGQPFKYLWFREQKKKTKKWLLTWQKSQVWGKKKIYQMSLFISKLHNRLNAVTA